MTSAQDVPLAEVMAPRLGSIDPSRYPDERFDLYSVPAFDKREPEVVTGIQVGSAKQVVEPGDVLLSRIVPHIRRAWVVGDNRGRRIIASGEWIVFRSERVDGAYLRHLFLSDRFHTQFMHTVAGVGGSLLRARPAYVRKIRVALPQLSEQRRIAGLLDRVEALLAKRRAVLAQLSTLGQAIFLDMFGDVARRGWRMVTVRDLAVPGSGSIRTGPFGSQLLHSEFTSEGIAVLGIDNAVENEFQWAGRRFISEAKYRQLRRYTVRPGDVLITIMGTCGRCAVVPNDIPLSISSKHLCCITLDPAKCVPGFLQAYFLSHPIAATYLRRAAKGAIMSGLNMAIIAALPVPAVPLDLQRCYESRIRTIENIKGVQRTSLAELDRLFSSLQHRAFRGEL